MKYIKEFSNEEEEKLLGEIDAVRKEKNKELHKELKEHPATIYCYYPSLVDKRDIYKIKE